MKTIVTKSGHRILIDNRDWDIVSQCSVWSIAKRGTNIYACGRIKGKMVYMHRLILGLTDPHVFTDHRNHNGLDNRRRNLRISTRGQNAKNRRKFHGKSVYKGVSLHKASGLFRATISLSNKHYNVGYFKTEREAAMAYDSAATVLHLDFASTNKGLGIL